MPVSRNTPGHFRICLLDLVAPRANAETAVQRCLGSYRSKCWKALQHQDGLNFDYRVSGNVVTSSRAKQMISKSDFERAYSLVPLDGPGQINKEVRGPAYVWAILHDRRFRRDSGEGKEHGNGRLLRLREGRP